MQCTTLSSDDNAITAGNGSLSLVLSEHKNNNGKKISTFPKSSQRFIRTLSESQVINVYSDRSEVTGFAEAALIDSKLTVNQAMTSADTNAIKNIIQPIAI